MLRKLNLFSRFTETVRLAPLEIVVSLLYCILCILEIKDAIVIGRFIWTFPIAFGFIYSMNRFVLERNTRWLYYASVLIIVPLGIWDFKVEHAPYWVSLLLCQLLVVYSRKDFENNAFIKEGLKYLVDLASALCLGSVCFLLMWATSESFLYIFDVYVSDSEKYIFSISYLILTPFFFLLFNTEPSIESGIGRFSELLVNFILSPALLVYMVILYLYLGKIIITWSLPKGGIAYMVISFIFLVFLTRALQPMLKKRYYDWFYSYFSWWVLPVLLLLWVGVSYRMSEYGLTETRFYLLLTVIMLTLAVGISFRMRRRSYAILAGISGLLLALFTYIPGMTAKDIGVVSQLHCLNRVIAELQIGNSLGHIVAHPPVDNNDSLTPLYRRLYDSFQFVEQEKGSVYMYDRFGVNNSEELRDSVVPYNMKEKNAFKRDEIYLFGRDRVWDGMDIREFSVIERVGLDKSAELYCYMSEGELIAKRGGEVIAKVDINEWFESCMVSAGLDIEESYTEEELEDYIDKLLVIDTEDVRLILDTLVIQTETNTVHELEVKYILSK